jgi:hypothetical protein
LLLREKGSIVSFVVKAWTLKKMKGDKKAKAERGL